MTDEDGHRVEAALQFGFSITGGDVDGYICTEPQLIAFAKACERAGMAKAVALLRIQPNASLWVAARLDEQIAATDAELAPILEANRAQP